VRLLCAVVQSEPDPEWLLRDDVRRGLEAAADAGLVYDLLVRQHQLASTVAVVGAVPGGRWVLDHAGKPVVDPAAYDEWRGHLDALAAHPDVSCKLSGLVTEAGSANPAQLAPVVDHLLEVFGPERLMWGSDWPVCELVCSYEEWYQASEMLLVRLDALAREQIYSGTARATYGI